MWAENTESTPILLRKTYNRRKGLRKEWVANEAKQYSNDYADRNLEET